jgi:hypothetical protein
MQFKNISRFGDLDLPLIGRVIAAGEIFETTPEQAELLILQPDLWQPIQPDDLSKLGLADLKALAAQQGIDTTGLKTKADYQAVLQQPVKPGDAPAPTSTQPVDTQETHA